MTSREIWFWQRILSPHMAGLAVELAVRGYAITYVAEQSISPHRAQQGWQPPEMPGVRLVLADNEAAVQDLARSAPLKSIHICQGIRGNGLVRMAQQALATRRIRQWVVMETVDDGGWRGVLKRWEYRRLFSLHRPWLEGVLATGHTTPDWVTARGMPASQVFPFAYFLPEPDIADFRVAPERFRFAFVGRFDENKGLDRLIRALGALLQYEFELVVIGSGPLEQALRFEAESTLSDRVKWVGRLPRPEVAPALTLADVLVLPSHYDGWGAVASEALMVGTPAICSNTCGVAGVVHASGVGGVFNSEDPESLIKVLEGVLCAGRVTSVERMRLIGWAECIGAKSGAEYLCGIIEHSLGQTKRPQVPWESNKID